jgi:hypothetical protein
MADKANDGAFSFIALKGRSVGSFFPHCCTDIADWMAPSFVTMVLDCHGFRPGDPLNSGCPNF